MNTRDCRPLEGLKVLELTHMVMGPACGLMLADLGADVIKVEPPGGDPTRRLPGSGAGYFPMYNRNKRSICLNLKSPEGMDTALKLADRLRRAGAELPPRGDGAPGAGLRDAVEAQSAPDLLPPRRGSRPVPTRTARRWTRWRR